MHFEHVWLRDVRMTTPAPPPPNAMARPFEGRYKPVQLHPGLLRRHANRATQGTVGTSPDHRIIYHTGKVFYDSDGTGPALQIAFVELDTIPILTAEDINWFT